MRYMIHAAPSRMWYVNEFLIPSMLKQGIDEKRIILRCDTEGKGNLVSCMESFIWCGEHTDDGTWHIQDDIVLCKDFAKRTKENDRGIVCGVVIKDWGPNSSKTGIQPVEELWYSFQCIRIPDRIAGECGCWFFTDAAKRRDPEYRNRILRKKHDDDFFRFFLLEKYPSIEILNLKPNLVDHIDYILGGSLINSERKREVNRVAYWEDDKIVDDLEDRVIFYRQQHEGEL